MLLRLTQHDEGENRHRVEVQLEGDGAPWKAVSSFSFDLTAQDEEDVRWYLEDFLQYPQEPAPTIARRVEGRMSELGKELFRGVFQGSEEARDLWAQVRDRLADTRVEVVTGVAAAVSLPWELLRDPRTDFPLALTAKSFVRAQPRVPLRARLWNGADGPVRILVVLCRPRGGQDVPFRSVASRLIKGLDDTRRAIYDLDLLRPPTFEQLGKTLRQAKAEGRPYHVVHFDGHGMYGEPGDLPELVRGMSAVQLMSGTGPHGFLAFENPELEENLELVGGPALGRLLHENDVPVLVLNACRSAHNEAPEKPDAAGGEGDDHHSQVRAFGSLAQEVMEAGVGGVVAMRYNVYVVTAAQMVGELYGSLARGRALGEAVTLARKNLADRPLREVAAGPRALQDWPVPVVYEAAPLRIFPAAREVEAPNFQVERKGGETVGGGENAAGLPPPPDVGFYGRDETLLALDRAFDRDRIVLLHAYTGSGKTTTAAEFARWYQKTGGVDGPVLFTSFERYLPLPRALDVLEQVFSPYLERGGVHWLALDDAQRRHVALQVLEQVPVLWVWDNVEPVAGFPAGTPSVWSAEEQQELVDFLRAVKGTKAKVLMTSRRDERGWLGHLPARIKVPAMPMLERLQLARAIAEKQGKKLAEVDWNPLLRFTEGNPLALTVLVRQALREGLRSQEEVKGFVAKLRAGEVGFADEVEEGRSKSLGASLAYGFEQAFSEEERRRLAVLALFQGLVDVDVLRVMGNPKYDWCLAEVRGLGREEWTALLDRAAEVGLLTPHGHEYYGIHPALPWFFRGLFDRFYPDVGHAALRAYVEAVGGLGDYYLDQYGDGNRDVIGVLRVEEANLLHARGLAREHGWWRRVTSAMQGLRQLYDHTGRRAEWKRLVEEIVPDFVDPASGGPLPGREEDWRLVAEYQVRLAMEERQWADAERLQSRTVEWDRERAAGALALDPGELEAGQRHQVRNLAVSLELLGYIRFELARTDCVPAHEEALELSERSGERAVAAACAFNLGHAYMDLPALRDLDQAERWYRRSLERYEERDRLGRGKCSGQLGAVAWEQFKEAWAAGCSGSELLAHLNEAARRYIEALDLLPSDAVDDLAVIHNGLGATYWNAGDRDRALPHFRQSIHYDEAQGNLHRAARTRFNIALALHSAGRRADALEYARVALRGFESYGDRAADMIQMTRELIEKIQS